MHFRFSAEHDELRRGLRRLLDDAAGPQAVLALADSADPYDAGLLERLVEEIGVFALALPEQVGGAGFGFVELGVVFHEAGRALLRGPLMSTTLASLLLVEAAADDPPVRALLAAIATGSRRAAAAVLETGGGWSDAPAATVAEPGGTAWTVTGVKEWVLDGQSADVLVVSARTPAGSALFLVEAGAEGVSVEPVASVDLSRRVSRLHLDGCVATPVGPDGGAGTALRRAHLVGLALLAAEQTGIAERCLEMAGAWALQREQFGRPIGSFQAIKHKLATIRLELEAAVSASMYALWSADHAASELPDAARIAAVTCGEAAVLAARENIQVHGGVGATWEHPAHLYLRRATLDRVLLGDTQTHLAELALSVDRIAAP